MDHRFQQQSARHGGGFARREIGRAHVEGNEQFRSQLSSSKSGSDSTSRYGSPLERHARISELQQSSLKEASGTSIKTLIHEEMSKERKARQSSPSVIAKLMGLDSLPPPQAVNKDQKETKNYLPKSTYVSRKDRSLKLSTSKKQEFKDVFEIKDSAKFEKQKTRSVFDSNSHVTQDETDVAFVRQKFMEAKRLSTDESLQNSKEFNEALEVLDTNKDLFLKFLEEPNSSFTKHLHELKGYSNSPRESNITILKSTRNDTYEADQPSKSKLMTERSQMQKDVMTSLIKPGSSLFNHLLKEHSGYLSHKLLKSRSAGKTSPSHRSTRIVVLKPDKGKAQDTLRNISQPSSPDMYVFAHKRHKEFENFGIRERNAEGKKHHVLFDNLEVSMPRTRGSREIPREVTKQKHMVSSGSDRMLVSDFNKHFNEEHLCTPPAEHTSDRSEAHNWALDNPDYWNRTCSPSSSSAESSVSREARKRLSERWRMTNKLHEARFVGKESSTLGEMLALPVREVKRDARGSFPVQQIPDEKITRGITRKASQHSSTSGYGSLKDPCSRKLPRSSSLPASSSDHGATKPSRQRASDGDSCFMLKDVMNLGVDDSFSGNLNQRRSSSRKSFKFPCQSPPISPSGEENKLPVREIHMNQEELKNGNTVSDTSEAKPTLCRLSNCNITSSSFLVNSPDTEMPPTFNENHLQLPVEKGKPFDNSLIDEISKESSLDHQQIHSVPPSHGEDETNSVIRSKDDEQPSPVSVFEHPSEDGQSSPECFERVSADLQGLRVQLQLLRMESESYNTECESSVSSEEAIGEPNSHHEKGEMLQTFKNEDDRDFSYLHDLLNELHTKDSAVHSLDKDTFENLENKYGVFSDWTKSERKLFFDLVSSILAEHPSLCTDQRPWLNSGRRKARPAPDSDRLIEGVWQMVVNLQKKLSRGKPDESILDPRWLDLGDGVDVVGREIEGMVLDELLQELVTGILFD